jgi:GNAT superfamily N-acetyltransferase
MPPIVEVPVRSRSALISLFEEHRRDRAFIDCVLEGHFGTARADRVSAPTVARLDCRPFTAFAGDPTSRDADALVRCAPIDWVTPDTDAWRELLLRVFADRIRVTPFVAFSSASLDVAALERHTRSVEDGYELCRLDAALSHRLLTDMKKAWLLESYASLDDFLRRGIGYVAVHERHVAASATSAVTSARAIDIDIETAPAHRRIGLATAVGAALALECLVRGIDPLWLASNDASCRLAEKLGYARVDRYETFEIAE